MAKAYFVQHSHWDREWYFTTEDAKVLSDQVFSEILKELKNNPKVNFCLDGQSSILDEYIELRPEDKELMKELIANGQLHVGPWFTQTDAFLVDAESILRNLMIGMHDITRKYGKVMKVGYLPDTFGFNAQIPTLLHQVGIDNFMCWRGINFDKLVESPYFIWKGLGERSVYASIFPNGYMSGLIQLDALNDKQKFIDKHMDPLIDYLVNRGNNEDILIPSGMDQKNILPGFDEVISELSSLSKHEFKVSSYPEFVEIIKNKNNLPEYQGDLREPVYARVHRTISSVRTQMKLENFFLEQKILRKIEPMVVIARKLGIDISQGLLDRLWKKVLENQAHDSIGGCVSDNVAEDIFHRIKEANEIADGIENLILKRIASDLKLNSSQVLVMNTDTVSTTSKKVIQVVAPNKNIRFPEDVNARILSEKYYEKRENIMRLSPTGYEFNDEPPYYQLEIELELELPAMGYRVIEFEQTDRALTSLEDHEVSKSMIENDMYQISFDNKSLNLTTADGSEFKDFVYLEDISNNGDTYDFSPLPNDESIYLSFDSAKVFVDKGIQMIRLTGSKKLPYDLDDRSGNGREELVTYTVELTLKDHSQTIDGVIHIDNKVLSHRMRLGLRVGELSQMPIAQIQNGFVRNAYDELPSDWKDKYVEKPVNIEVFDKSLTVELESSYMNIYVDGLKEYEYVDDSLYITLLATTGELGKPNLEYRPGRASGDTTSEGHIMMATPLAQEPGIHRRSFAIEIINGEFDEAYTAHQSLKRLSPSISYQLQNLNFFIHRLDNKIWPNRDSLNLKSTSSMFELPDNLIVTAVHQAYTDKDSYVVRYANPTKQDMILEDGVIEDGIVVNAIEEQLEHTTKISAYDYLTVMYKY